MAEDAREKFIRESYDRRQRQSVNPFSLSSIAQGPERQRGISGIRQAQRLPGQASEATSLDPFPDFDDHLRSNWEYNKFQTKVNEPRYFGMEQSVMDAMLNKYNQYPWSIYSTPDPEEANVWDVFSYNIEDLPPRFNINRGGLMSLV